MNYITQHGNAYFNQHPIGTGPTCSPSRVIGQSFTLTRYDGYWGPKPYYQTLKFSIIPDDNSRIAASAVGPDPVRRPGPAPETGPSWRATPT